MQYSWYWYYKEFYIQEIKNYQSEKFYIKVAHFSEIAKSPILFLILPLIVLKNNRTKII